MFRSTTIALIAATTLTNAINFCGDLSPHLPSECSCEDQNEGATVKCGIDFFGEDTITLTGDLELCQSPARATIVIDDSKFGVHHELAGLTAGRALDFPIPGLSLDVPDIGSVGVNAVFDIEGDIENLEIKLGLDACGTVLGHKACGSELTDELPIYVLDHTFDFDSLCKQAMKEAETRLYKIRNNDNRTEYLVKNEKEKQNSTNKTKIL